LSSNLQTHKRNVHSNRRPYQCPVCCKMFKRKSNVKFHVRIHTDTKPTRIDTVQTVLCDTAS